MAFKSINKPGVYKHGFILFVYQLVCAGFVCKYLQGSLLKHTNVKSIIISTAKWH